MDLEKLLNSSQLIFPAFECIHIASFILAIGVAALVDFQLLGFTSWKQTPAQLMRSTSLWMLGALMMVLFSGMGLYLSDPDTYYLNWAFLIKMACLIAAVVFHYTIFRTVTNSGGAAARKAVACVSLLLWSSIVFGGIFIAFIEGGL